MNTGTYYLYEYKKNRRLRNAGFLKITKQYHSCFLQLNARGIPVTTKDTLKLSAFYNDNHESHALHLSDVICNDQTISAKITAAESKFPGQRTLNRIDGFFLVLPQGEVLAAVSPDAEFDTRNIQYLPEMSEPVDSTAGQDEALQLDSESSTAGQDEAGQLDSENSRTAQAETQAEAAQCETRCIDTGQVENVSMPESTDSMEDSQRKTAKIANSVESRQHKASETTDSVESKQHKASETVRKIQRSELSTLPRKHWHLANNSFLLHGYYNYNHLLLIEEDGHYWLGVPGIYDPRESRAAELFGFSQFTDSYNTQLALTEDECNAYGRFGYWCRYLK